jgi:nucleoside-diphosphate-sugar epimerase
MSGVARYLVVGCGYVGTRLAKALLARGPVIGVASRPESAAALDRQGIDGYAWDLDDEASTPARLVSTPATIFYLVPPQPSGTTDERLARFLRRLTVTPNRILYMSTTGVYGDTGGEPVAEDAPLKPGSDRARRRVDAEAQLMRFGVEHRVPWTILRVPGIYGPGRLPTERLRRGEPMIRHSEAPPSSRIHVDDLVAACLLAIAAPQAKNRIYNVADGNATTMTEYFERVATLAGLPPPTLISRERAEQVLSPELWSFVRESRRIDAQRIREELGFAPRFSDLRLGILSSLPAP